MTSDFEAFLIDKHADQYQGLDDEMIDDFYSWTEDLEYETLVKYADEYSASLYLEGMRDCTKLISVINERKEKKQ
jgi:hypothetical protein